MASLTKTGMLTTHSSNQTRKRGDGNDKNTSVRPILRLYRLYYSGHGELMSRTDKMNVGGQHIG